MLGTLCSPSYLFSRKLSQFVLDFYWLSVIPIGCVLILIGTISAVKKNIRSAFTRCRSRWSMTRRLVPTIGIWAYTPRIAIAPVTPKKSRCHVPRTCRQDVPMSAFPIGVLMNPPMLGRKARGSSRCETTQPKIKITPTVSVRIRQHRCKR